MEFAAQQQQINKIQLGKPIYRMVDETRYCTDPQFINFYYVTCCESLPLVISDFILYTNMYKMNTTSMSFPQILTFFFVYHVSSFKI